MGFWGSVVDPISHVQMKIGTVALIIAPGPEPRLLESISDELEIATLEVALNSGSEDPLQAVYEVRAKRSSEDEDFGNYVEGLLSKPFMPDEVRQHGVQWFKSKNRIEQFQKAEGEARAVITDFAFKLFKSEPSRQEFVLASSAAEVRVRVFVLKKVPAQKLQAA